MVLRALVVAVISSLACSSLLLEEPGSLFVDCLPLRPACVVFSVERKVLFFGCATSPVINLLLFVGGVSWLDERVLLSLERV